VRQLRVDWDEARVRAEIAEIMGAMDEEDHGIEIKDSDGRIQAEWIIAEGWTYRTVRGRGQI
jgi:hypothetical protein